MRKIAFLQFAKSNDIAEYRSSIRSYFQVFIHLLNEIDASGPYFHKSAQVDSPNIWVGQANATYKEYSDAILGLKEKWTELQRKSEGINSVEKKKIVSEELKAAEAELREVLSRMNKRIDQLDNTYQNFSKEERADSQIYAAITKLHLLRSRTFKDLVKYWWMTIGK